MTIKSGALIAASLALAGCAGKGPLPVYSQGGVEAPPPSVTQYPNVNPLANFRIAAQNAQTLRSSDSYTEFMRSGFSLINIRCTEFFDKKGTDQANANLVRDLIAPLTAIVSGVFALHNYKNPDNAEHDIMLLTLGTTSAISGLDIYSKHFLFGAENIDSVKNMTRAELNTHAAAALNMTPGSIEEAALQIIDNQSICTPSHILASAKTAIANERFAASVPGAGAAITNEMLGQLGSALSLTPPIVTATQAGLLYAATMGYVRTQPEMKLVHTRLEALKDANPIAKDDQGKFTIKSDFPFAKLKQVFDAAPAATRLALESQSKAIMPRANAKAAKDEEAMRVAGGKAGVDFSAFAIGSDSEYSLPEQAGNELRHVSISPQ